MIVGNSVLLEYAVRRVSRPHRDMSPHHYLSLRSKPPAAPELTIKTLHLAATRDRWAGQVLIAIEIKKKSSAGALLSFSDAAGSYGRLSNYALPRPSPLGMVFGFGESLTVSTGQ